MESARVVDPFVKIRAPKPSESGRIRLRHTDQVVVMGDGMVLEQGEPGVLLESGGAFAELWGGRGGE